DLGISVEDQLHQQRIGPVTAGARVPGRRRCTLFSSGQLPTISRTCTARRGLSSPRPRGHDAARQTLGGYGSGRGAPPAFIDRRAGLWAGQRTTTETTGRTYGNNPLWGLLIAESKSSPR